MAGVLAKEPRSKDSWEKVAFSARSYIAGDQSGCLATLALSYDYLTFQLRECFLYLGRFEKYTQINFFELILSWMAEGFIQEDGIRSLQEIAISYGMDLVDRNLLIITERNVNGVVRFCKVHDLVMQLCLEKVEEERFFLRIDSPPSDREVFTTYKQRRVITNQEIHIGSMSYPPTPSIRLLFYYHSETTFIYNIAEYFRSFALLRVLIIKKCKLIDFPSGLALLVHLRFLDMWQSSFPSSICSLWNLQTLTVRTSCSSMVLPRNISNLLNLRHLFSNAVLYLPSVGKPMKLEVISNVVLGDGVDNFQKCFPRIRVPTSTLYSDKENDFEVLLYLESLKLIGSGSRISESNEPEIGRCEPKLGKKPIKFPVSLKTLALLRCRLPWSDMSIIQSLPNLECLILEENGFEGTLWKTGEEQFQKLRVLKLEKLNIKQWDASSINFPCLERLGVMGCIDLEEITLEIGDISTLESINVYNCRSSLLTSLQKIRQEQDYAGNYELKIKVDGSRMPSCVPKHDE